MIASLPQLQTLPERFPFACQWEITCRCNLRCVMCYTDCFNRPEKIREELTTGEILRIMDELAAAGCVELCLTGGEPLTRPDFREIYEHAHARGFLITIFTNGTLLTEGIADWLAARVPHRIEISLHSLMEDRFDGITRGKGSFQRCMNAVRLALDRKLPLVLKTTAMTVNKDEVLAIKRHVEGLGAVAYKLGVDMRPTLDGSEAPASLGLSPSELSEITRQDPELWTEVCRTQQPMPPCESGKRTFHIDAYGQLQLCSANRRQGYDLRHGSFTEGFYHALPTFACPFKTGATDPLIPLSASHA